MFSFLIFLSAALFATEEIKLLTAPKNSNKNSFPLIPEASMRSRKKYAAKNLGTE